MSSEAFVLVSPLENCGDVLKVTTIDRSIARLFVFWLELKMLFRTNCKRSDRTSSGNLSRRWL